MYEHDEPPVVTDEELATFVAKMYEDYATGKIGKAELNEAYGKLDDVVSMGDTGDTLTEWEG